MSYKYYKLKIDSIVVLLLLFFTIQGVAQINRPVGINLAGIEDWSEEFVFVNVMNQSREWITHGLADGSEWSSGVDIPMRTDGYPIEIPYDNGIDPPQGLRALLYFGELENIYPSGNYQLKIEGTGTVELWGAASGIFNSPIDTTIMVDNSLGGIAIEILESKIEDPIHNIKMIMPGFENLVATDPFHPELIDFLEDFQVIRFMDWMKTNDSEVKTWSDRTTSDYITQTASSGVAYEHIINLCNRLKKDPWINIPHQADDNFIEEFARLFRDQLDPELTIYVEYSNEVWNSIFSQNIYAAEQAAILDYPGEPWEQSWQYTAKRSADVFEIFEEEFVNDNRFVKVLPGFAASPWVTNFILESFHDPFYNPNGITADALTIAPYFGGALGDEISEQGLEESTSVEQLMDSLALRLPESYTYMSDTKALADNFDLRFIAYEGGQHVVANWPYNQNEQFVEKLLEVNRHPRMEEFYCEYFDQWYDTVGGELFCHFSSHGQYNQFGAWGIKETYDDVEAPKYEALKNCVFEKNITTSSEPEFGKMAELKLYPNPVDDQITIEAKDSNYNVSLINSSGQEVAKHSFQGSQYEINMNGLPDGLYFMRITNGTTSDVQLKKVVKL